MVNQHTESFKMLFQQINQSPTSPIHTLGLKPNRQNVSWNVLRNLNTSSPGLGIYPDLPAKKTTKLTNVCTASSQLWENWPQFLRASVALVFRSTWSPALTRTWHGEKRRTPPTHRQGGHREGPKLGYHALCPYKLIGVSYPDPIGIYTTNTIYTGTFSLNPYIP